MEMNTHMVIRGPKDMDFWKTTQHADQDTGILRTLAAYHRHPFILLTLHPGLWRQESRQPSCSLMQLTRGAAVCPVPR